MSGEAHPSPRESSPASITDLAPVMSEEIETTMRLLGVTNLDQLSAKYINTVALEREFIAPADGAEAPRWTKL